MSINPDDAPDGPTEVERPRKPIPREESGEDIYEKPTLRIKEKPDDNKPQSNVRER